MEFVLSTTLQCVFDNVTVNVEYYETGEGHDKPFEIYMISCAIPINAMIPMRSVIVEQVVYNDDTNRTTHRFNLSIDYVIDDDDVVNNYRYSVCVPLLQGTRYGAGHLIEFMELSKLFGVDHVFIYTNRTSLSLEMNRALDYYSDKR